MKIGIFEPVSYLSPDVPRGFPLAPKHFEPSCGIESMEASLGVFELADDLGFDHVAVAEHHFAPRQLTPDPNLFAAALTQRVRNAQIAVLGALLPMLDPVRVAEQFAMLDVLCRGRLLPGVFRGTPNELMVYHSNPAESRARYEEAARLIQRCWLEPEPFGWEGVHFRYRSIALWPRPVQQPAPRLLVSGNSAESARFAGKNQFNMGFSLGNLPAKAQHIAEYKAAAQAAGWTPAPENVLTRYIIYVAATDKKAHDEFMPHLAGNALDPARIQYLRALMAAGVGRPLPAFVPQPVPPPGAPVPTTVQPTAGGFPTLIGSPDTLLRKMHEIVETTGVGRFDLIFTGDRLPNELGVGALKLFANEMLPTLQKLDPRPTFDRLELARGPAAAE